jgi:PiT family inorganic phosphate transporter
METSLYLIIPIIAIALIFDFTNGLHDAANSISTVVSTRVLSPRIAVLWAAFFNFIAFLIFHTGVASTIGKGLVNIDIVTPLVILAGLIGAISWNLITWYFGLPSSSSHALIGGYAGAAIAKGGFGALITTGGWSNSWLRTLIFLAVAPLIGLVVGFILKVITTWIVRRQSPAEVTRWSRVAQIFSAAAFSLGHGGNDAQKTMGVISSLLFTGGLISVFHVPLWVVLCAQTAMAVGTFTGGWRIVKTMGQKITKLRPIDGFCAETAAASSIFLSTYLSIPVSTTHVITGAISGVGAVNRVSAVRWGVTLRIVWAWIFTIPASALIASIIYMIIRLFS